MTKDEKELIRELRRQVREWRAAAYMNTRTIQILAERVAPQPLTVTATEETAPSPATERAREWERITKSYYVDIKKMGHTQAKRIQTRRLNLWREKWQGSV